MKTFEAYKIRDNVISIERHKKIIVGFIVVVLILLFTMRLSTIIGSREAFVTIITSDDYVLSAKVLGMHEIEIDNTM